MRTPGQLTTLEVQVLHALKSLKADGYDVPPLSLIAQRSRTSPKTFYAVANGKTYRHVRRAA